MQIPTMTMMKMKKTNSILLFVSGLALAGSVTYAVAHGPDHATPHIVETGISSQLSPAALAFANNAAAQACTSCVGTSQNGATVSLLVGSSVTLELPATQYHLSALQIDPATVLDQTPAVTTDTTNAARAFTALAPGTAHLTVPGANGTGDFHVTIVVSPNPHTQQANTSSGFFALF